MSVRSKLCDTCGRYHPASKRTRIIKRKKSKLPRWKRRDQGIKPISPAVWAKLQEEKRRR